MASKNFGKLLPLSEGEPIFQEFMKMRNRPHFLENLKKLLEKIHDALRYYTEDQQFFVFDKGMILSLLNRLKGEDDIIVLYPGMRDDGRPGRPTLVACPYKKMTDDTFEFVPSLDGKSDVAEHSGLLPKKTPPAPFKIPLEIELDDISKTINFLS